MTADESSNGRSGRSAHGAGASAFFYALSWLLANFFGELVQRRDVQRNFCQTFNLGKITQLRNLRGQFLRKRPKPHIPTQFLKKLDDIFENSPRANCWPIFSLSAFFLTSRIKFLVKRYYRLFCPRYTFCVFFNDKTVVCFIKIHTTVLLRRLFLVIIVITGWLNSLKTNVRFFVPVLIFA